MMRFPNWGSGAVRWKHVEDRLSVRARNEPIQEDLGLTLCSVGDLEKVSTRTVTAHSPRPFYVDCQRRNWSRSQ